MKQNFKRLLSVILAMVILTVSLVGCADQTTTIPEESDKTESLKAGTYSAVGKGRNGDINVEVTFDKTSITDIKILEHSETEGIGETAIERIPAAIIGNQSVAVDGISGATTTSDAIIEAVKDAIVQAGGNLEDFLIAVETEGEEEVHDTQLAVVGAGAAGLMAAMYAS